MAQDVYLQIIIWLLATKPLASTSVEVPFRVAKRNSRYRDRLQTTKSTFKPYKPNPNFSFELNRGPKNGLNSNWACFSPEFKVSFVSPNEFRIN